MKIEKSDLIKDIEATEDTPIADKNVIVVSTVVKRLAALLVDFFLIGIVFLILQSFIVPLAADGIANVNQVAFDYQERLCESGLYVMANDKTTQIISIFSEEDKKNKSEEYFATIDTGIASFYSNESFYVEHKDFGMAKYNERKLASELFMLENDKYVTTEKATFTTLEKFYLEEYDQALKFLSIDNECLTLSRKITVATVVEVLVSLTIPFLIFYLILPLCLKNGATLGKKLMGVGVASRRDGFAPKKSQILIRFLVFYIFEFILSIFTLGIPLFVTFTMMFFSKEKICIHDYLAATICVDTKQCLIFKNEEEFKDYHLHVD